MCFYEKKKGGGRQIHGCRRGADVWSFLERAPCCVFSVVFLFSLFFPKQHLKNVKWWGLGEVPIGAMNSKKTTLLSSGRLLLPLLSKVSRDEQVCIFWAYRSFCASWGLHWWFGFKIRRAN